MYVTCGDTVSRGGSVATKFNTSNLREHLKTHSAQFKDLLEEEKKKQEQSKKKHKGASSNQKTLKLMIERR